MRCSQHPAQRFGNKSRCWKAKQGSYVNGDEEGSERWEDETGAYIEEDHPEEDPEDDEAVYLSEAYREWEVHYLRRLAMRIHRLLTLELDRAEEALFAVFVQHDANLDGRVRGEEASKLMQASKTVMLPLNASLNELSA
ncbi:unnamed protein product, partial [Symbiodinium pilosum]